jgi:DnaK suppressor protein
MASSDYQKQHGSRPKPEELRDIKNRLLKSKQEIWRELVEDLEKDAGEEYQDLVQTVKDEGDASLAELRESTLFSLIEMKAQELEMIEGALRRVESGEYGRCLDCGHWIRDDRLQALPHAVRCRACQEKWEKSSNR